MLRVGLEHVGEFLLVHRDGESPAAIDERLRRGIKPHHLGHIQRRLLDAETLLAEELGIARGRGNGETRNVVARRSGQGRGAGVDARAGDTILDDRLAEFRSRRARISRLAVGPTGDGGIDEPSVGDVVDMIRESALDRLAPVRPTVVRVLQFHRNGVIARVRAALILFDEVIIGLGEPGCLLVAVILFRCDGDDLHDLFRDVESESLVRHVVRTGAPIGMLGVNERAGDGVLTRVHEGSLRASVIHPFRVGVFVRE